MELEKSECVLNINDFSDNCIKKEFVSKFKGNLNGYKPVTERFFKNFKEIKKQNAITDFLKDVKSTLELSGWIVFGSYKNPKGYALEGIPLSVNNLMIFDDDTCVYIRGKNRDIYLFYDCNRNKVYLIEKSNDR